MSNNSLLGGKLYNRGACEKELKQMVLAVRRENAY